MLSDGPALQADADGLEAHGDIKEPADRLRVNGLVLGSHPEVVVPREANSIQTSLLARGYPGGIHHASAGLNTCITRSLSMRFASMPGPRRTVVVLIRVTKSETVRFKPKPTAKSLPLWGATGSSRGRSEVERGKGPWRSFANSLPSLVCRTKQRPLVPL